MIENGISITRFISWHIIDGKPVLTGGWEDGDVPGTLAILPVSGLKLKFE